MRCCTLVLLVVFASGMTVSPVSAQENLLSRISMPSVFDSQRVEVLEKDEDARLDRKRLQDDPDLAPLLGSGKTDVRPEPIASRDQQVSRPTPVTISWLSGRWSTSLKDGSAFAIQIRKDQTFQLVHLRGGKSSVSSGKTELLGAKLTLAGRDGTRLFGSIDQLSTNQFRFSVQKKSGEVAARMVFKKAP
ncbi:MAG: hypothetical protein AAGA03_15035 [Planctomycetota bacterium]